VDIAAFDEHDVTLDGVAGTLSLPSVTGPVPAVVLLSGSGAHDRDETIGRNKPLKDIAWGLASRGVAALRLDKVTMTAAPPGFTVYDEYAPAQHVDPVSGGRHRGLACWLTSRRRRPRRSPRPGGTPDA
jgi:hypothetical protein